MMATLGAVRSASKSASLTSKASVAAATSTPSAAGQARGEGGRGLTQESAVYVILLVVSLSLSMLGCWDFYRSYAYKFVFVSVSDFFLFFLQLIDILVYDMRLTAKTIQCPSDFDPINCTCHYNVLGW